MTDAPPPPPSAPPAGAGGAVAKGCFGFVGIGVLVVVLAMGGAYWWAAQQREAALAAQAEKAEAEYAPVRAAMKGPAAEPPPPPDLDKTARVIHEIDGALRGSDDMGAYLRALAQHDYRGVDPAVLAARQELMDVLIDMYKVQAEAEDQAELWAVSSELLLSALSVVKVQGDYNGLFPSGSVKVDAQQAKTLLEDLQRREDRRLDLGRQGRELEDRLIQALVRYSGVYHEQLEAWDRLCALRDRAYLAARAGDWASAAAAAEEAIALAPQEREAHLLLALALIEGGDREDSARIESLLAASIQAHPGASAPALLLRGVHRSRSGDPAQGLLDLEQAAAYYPRQAAELEDLLDPYKARGFLELTREGSSVVELYRATMLGAGWFSPDLQIAALHQAAGRPEAALAKVLDHFHRRRAQGEWSAILADIDAAQVLLGDVLPAAFPEGGWLDLEAKPTLIGESLSITLNNRSTRTLHNATLVLALQYTEMHPDDYLAFRAGETVPAVNAKDRTSFGDVPVGVALRGEQRGVDHIVQTRAVLISDEAVVWVDTEAYRIAEAAEGRRRAREGGATPAAVPQAVAPIVRATEAAGQMELISRLMGDEVVVRLPMELSALRPLFRLQRGEASIAAESNLLHDDGIELRFTGLRGLIASGEADDLELVASTAIGELVVRFAGQGERLRVRDVRLR